MGKVIGIDLGTTNSCAAVLEGGSPVIIPNSEGERTTPSVVAFGKSGEVSVGNLARRQAVTNADHTITSIKREMGSSYRKLIGDREMTPQEISALILRKLKKDAEAFLGETITEAVITVPAYFNDAQRQATKDAGRIAGLNVLRIINEPTSAALAYGLNHGDPKKILVYDLGGGTFDVSVIEIGDALIEVLATAGDNHLGGDDFDARLTDYIAGEFRRKERVNCERDLTAMQRIREAAENAKKELSLRTETTINLPFLMMSGNEPKHLEMTVTRAVFEELTRDLLAKTEGPVLQALSDAGLTRQDIDMVLLVGGSTRMPAVQEKVRLLTGKEPAKSMNPDECVAMGAAIQGAKLSGDSTALGTSAANEIILMDVTPLSLSIETVGGVATRLIDRNSTIPIRKSKIFTTAANFQTQVEIKVLQGERHMARDNMLLGNFKLTGIKRAMAGVPQIEVTFDIDANGIVKVSAKDMGTGRQQEIVITSGNNMSEEDIQRAIDDAVRNEAEDSARREATEMIGEAAQLAGRVHTSLNEKDAKARLGKENYKRIKKDLNDLEKKLARMKPGKYDGDAVNEIKILKENLEQSARDLI